MGVDNLRRYYQRQLLEAIETIKEANYLIERYIKEGKFEAALNLLIDCHDGAVSIGGRIEKLEGEGKVTVSYLEEYCDTLYLAGIAIKENDNKLKKITKLLHNLIIKIRDSMLEDIKIDRIEIAFLPYKASMWDSMESIWMAAKKDPMFDVYVVPIPYFKRRPNGELGEMYYEGRLYPSEISVVDWQEYKLEERRPDIIFIHNPYDDGNFVTSIHPYYYSSNLKKYTDLLCYVPYFISIKDVAEHFVLCSGVLNANKVFLQSEKIKDTYSRIFKEFCNKNHLNDRFGKAEEKFIAAGSPKLDKITNSDKRDFALPEAWKRKIEKLDGTRKPIILYNTSVGAILKEDKEYIQKLRSIFELFRNRSDVVLWWRPHPLSETTYDAMRPHLLEEYKKIVEEYKKDKIGIYDDSADLHRALQLSSILYTDYSSLIPMYQHMGKPVIIQKANNNADYLTFDNVLDDGDYFWISASNINGLFKVNKKNLRAKYMGSFCGETISGRLFTEIIKHDDNLYFIPYAANAIAVYNVKTNEFSSVELKAPDGIIQSQYNPKTKFAFAALYQDFLYLFPKTYPAIVKYNCTTMEVEYLSEPMNLLNKNPCDEIYGYFQNGYISGQYITMFSSRVKRIVRFDMEQDTFDIIEKCENDYTYGRIESDGENYWLVPFSVGAPILGWNIETKEKFIIKEFPKGIRCGVRPFACSAIFGNYIWMLPGMANKAIKFNLQSKEITVSEEFSVGISSNNPEMEQWVYSFVKDMDSKLYAFNLVDKKLSEYNPLNGSQRREYVEIDTDDKENCGKLRAFYLKNAFGEGGQSLVHETNCIGFKDFIDYFFSNGYPTKTKIKNSVDFVNKDSSFEDGASGERILKYCKERVLSSNQFK